MILRALGMDAHPSDLHISNRSSDALSERLPVRALQTRCLETRCLYPRVGLDLLLDELSVEDVSVLTVVEQHRNFVGHIERGEQNVSVLGMRRLADALGCAVGDLVPPDGTAT